MEEAWELAAIMASRHVPNAIKRQLLEEAGYRCAITTCKSTSALQYEHIEDWSRLNPKRHEFDKMIVLCATCHARVTSGEIDKNAVRAYKRNLAVVSARYSLFEIRLLERYWEEGLSRSEKHPSKLTHTGTIPHIFNDIELIHLKGLQRDQLISVSDHKFYSLMHPAAKQIAASVGQEHAPTILGGMNMNQYMVIPTFKALEFIENYFSGRVID